MLIARALLGICLIAFSLLAVCAESPPKVPSNEAKSGASSATADKRGTDEVPLAVKVLPAPDAQAKAAQEERQRTEKAAADAEKAALDEALVRWTRYLFIATAFLFVAAAFQVGLFWFQLRLIRKGTEDAGVAATAAKDAADAAQTQARAIMGSERARIFVEVMHTSIQRLPRHGEVPSVQLRAVNHGKTAAILVRITALCVARDNEPTEMRQAEDRLIREGVAIPPGEDWKFGAEPLLDEFREEDASNLNVVWYCMGTFEYRDIFGQRRVTGFCFETKGPGSGFVFSHRNPLNYQT